MADFEGAGLQVGDVAYYVGELPGRKRVQLYRHKGPVITAVAGFRDEEQAAEFLRWLQRLANTQAR